MSLTEDTTPSGSPSGTAAVKTRRKLIEVALPLDAINAASAREKAIRHGHPSTLHLWWARRPLAAARAVVFSQMVDDPGEYTDELLADPATRERAVRELRVRSEVWAERRANQEAAKNARDVAETDTGPEPTLEECAADLERERLFRLIERLVVWENTTNESLLEQARAEIRRSWRRTCADNRDHPRAAELFDPERLPAFHDPFAGGGALPLEAQRLGLEAHASDLNPVAVLINKAMIEIPPRFAGRPPVNPESRTRPGHSGTWNGAAGLADDVRHYGNWMRNEAERRIGDLYPPIEVTTAMAADRPDLRPYLGQKLRAIAWIWARTVKSPNPAFATVDVPLASTFLLSTKPGKEAWIEPVIDGTSYVFNVRTGDPKRLEGARSGTKLARGANFACLMSGSPIGGDYIKAEGIAGRLGARLMAIVAEGDRGRVYLSPTREQETAARGVEPAWKPDLAQPDDSRAFWTVAYGFRTFGDLFSPRQLVALQAFSDLVSEAAAQARLDAVSAGLSDDGIPLRHGGAGAAAYADAIATLLALSIGKAADYWSSIAFWHNGAAHQKIVNTFARQAVPMTWDFAEANPFSESSGHFMRFIDLIAEVLAVACSTARPGSAQQADAQAHWAAQGRAVSTDPPYYDNIGYADLSDFFYVWLRPVLRTVYPDLFATLAVPKVEELVATPYRHGGRESAEKFFLKGMTGAMHNLAVSSHPAFPVTIYYAFKQSETADGSGTASTGWETFLEAVGRAGLSVGGTWPVRTEMPGNLKKTVNALASSIVLVCRQSAAHAASVSRREFLAGLKSELPRALAQLQRGNIAPVDLAQAAIGPGMAVFTRYDRVLDAEGRPLKVREALALINQVLDEVLAEQEGDFDADSRWALLWFDQFGFAEQEFGRANDLAVAKNTSVDGMRQAGILSSGHGKVRLLRPDELDPDWDPTTDIRRPAWQSVHQLILAADRGEAALAELITKLGPEADIARELAYRLYVLCDRKKRATEAGWYNGLVQSWPEAVRLASERPAADPVQGQLFGEG
jgi:putative DNA methylase